MVSFRGLVANTLAVSLLLSSRVSGILKVRLDAQASLAISTGWQLPSLRRLPAKRRQNRQPLRMPLLSNWGD